MKAKDKRQANYCHRPGSFIPQTFEIIAKDYTRIDVFLEATSEASGEKKSCKDINRKESRREERISFAGEMLMEGGNN